MRDFSLPSKPHIKGFFFQNQSLCLIIDSIAFMPPMSSNGPPKQSKKPKTEEGLNSGVLVKHTREFTISPTNIQPLWLPNSEPPFPFFLFSFLRFSKLFVHHHRRQRKPLPLSKARPYSSNLHYTTLSWYILYYILIILFVLLFKKVINLVALINAMWLGTLFWLES